MWRNAQGQGGQGQGGQHHPTPTGPSDAGGAPPPAPPSAPAEPPLLFLDVHVTPSQVARVPLWAGSDVYALAAAFAAQHSLAPRLAERLARLMQQKQAEAIANAGEGR